MPRGFESHSTAYVAVVGSAAATRETATWMSVLSEGFPFRCYLAGSRRAVFVATGDVLTDDPRLLRQGPRSDRCGDDRQCVGESPAVDSAPPGLAGGSLVSTILLYEIVVRKPPVGPTRSTTTASVTVGVGWLLAIALSV